VAAVYLPVADRNADIEALRQLPAEAAVDLVIAFAALDHPAPPPAHRSYSSIARRARGGRRTA
jgi:hypothetical protein